jgi:HD-like signal output (HDOD) protein
LLHALGEIPILLSGRRPDHYLPVTIAAWGKRLASSWRLPSALVSAIAAYDTGVHDGAPDPMQLVIGTARRLVNSQVLEAPPPAVVLLDRGERASEAAKCPRLN